MVQVKEMLSELKKKKRKTKANPKEKFRANGNEYNERGRRISDK